MGRRSSLANMPLAALESELRRRQVVVRRLQRRYHTVVTRADRLADQIRELGGEARSEARSKGRGLQRPRNTATLMDALSRLLDGKATSEPK